MNLTGHKLQILSQRMLMYHKVIPNSFSRKDDEIEIVLLVNGTSYAGIGWRPINLGPICKSYPFISDALVARSNLIDTSNKNRRQSTPIGSPWAAQDVFSAMDCSDIIIGSAKGSLSRLRDSYSRGRHTPLPDSNWGGTDDITAATGWENNGVTTLIFRRRLRSRDIPDHSLDKGEMLVIWARGQEPDEFVQDPAARLERNEPRVSKFYVQDEIKYHGLGDQKGYLVMDFLSTASPLRRG